MFGLGVLYVLTGAAWWLSEADPVRRGNLAPVDPYLAVLETIIVLAAPLMVMVMGAVYVEAPPAAKGAGLAAVAFMALLAGVTCGVHFVELTVTRRLDAADVSALTPLLSFRWPSVLFALDLLAWDLFFGLSMLLGAAAFRGGGLPGKVRGGMLLSGALCLAGLLGPCLGDLRFQLPAIVGYAFVFPVVCLMMARHLDRRTPRGDADHNGVAQ